MFRTSIEYQELEHSMPYNLGRNDASAQRMVIVDWTDAFQFCKDIRGGVTITGQTQDYTPPDTFPDYPYLFVLNVAVEGLGNRGLDSRGIITFEKAKITISYGIIRDPSSGDSQRANVVFITETRSFSVEHQQLKSKNLYFLKTPVTYLDLLNTGGRIPDNRSRGTGRVRAHNIRATDINFNDPIGDDTKARIVIPRMELNIDIHWWNNYPDDDFHLMWYLGRVNRDYYRPLLTTYPPQTLLFAACNRQRQYTSEGVGAWQLSFKFLINVDGWNTTYREQKWKIKTDTNIFGGEVTKTKVIDKEWPPGFYPIGTTFTGTDDDSITDDTPIRWPYRPVDFTNNFLPHGFQERDFSNG